MYIAYINSRYLILSSILLKCIYIVNFLKHVRVSGSQRKNLIKIIIYNNSHIIIVHRIKLYFINKKVDK